VASAFDERLLHLGTISRWVALSRMRLRICVSHVRSELNRRCLTVFTTKVCSNIRLFAIAAAPDSETVSVEKESSMSPATLAVYRVFFDGYSDRCVSDVHDGVCRSHIMPRRRTEVCPNRTQMAYQSGCDSGLHSSQRARSANGSMRRRFNHLP